MSNFVGDLSSGYAISVSLFATSTGVTTDTLATGASVDCSSDVANILTAVQVVGSLAGTGTPSLTGKVQESTDGSNNWTDVTGGSFGAAQSTTGTQVVAFKPTKRYVRTTGTVAGTNPVIEAASLIIFPNRTAPINVGGFSTTVAAG